MILNKPVCILPDDDEAVVSLFDLEVVCVDAPET